ncbi:MAG: SEC-C domain-containing protein [Planctomycetaceae bacterium]|nr:SEC-C domain-containing protein [Planctomycetaceae bacterium]
MDEVRERVAKGPAGLQQAFDRLRSDQLEDTVAELSSWAGYQEAEQRRAPRTNPSRQNRIDHNDDRQEPHSSTTIVREQPRVSRNDPCPCGSGKKYKKCCGRD